LVAVFREERRKVGTHIVKSLKEERKVFPSLSVEGRGGMVINRWRGESFKT